MSEITEVVVVADPMVGVERIAVAGFLAGYRGNTRRGYATDLRLFAAWCEDRSLRVFGVRRPHLELYARWMEETGRMRSTVGRRLSTPSLVLPLLRARAVHRPQPGGERPAAQG